MGLGLALVQRLAELHGGYATCQSEGVDRGSTFQVYLPLLHHAGPRVTLQQPAVNSPAASLPSRARTRVLLIDDQREAFPQVIVCDIADRVRALAAGFQMHLTKSVALAELITVLSSVARGMRV